MWAFQRAADDGSGEGGTRCSPAWTSLAQKNRPFALLFANYRAFSCFCPNRRHQKTQAAHGIRAFALADNRLAELATWDERIVATELKELSLLNLNFSIEATGFTVPEIDIRIESLTAGNCDDAADEIIDALPGNPVSRDGDLWLLGGNRVYCGSALDPLAYEKLMGRERAEMVFTDPPYNRPIKDVAGKGRRRYREFHEARGEMTKPAFTHFLTSAFQLMAKFSIDGSIHYICIDWRHLAEISAAIAAVYSLLLNVAVWAKSVGGMGSMYRSAYELIFIAKNGCITIVGSTAASSQGF